MFQIQRHIIFTSTNTNSPLLSSCHKKVKCKAISISFSINTIQYNEAVNSTSSKNSLSDTSKFQSFLKYLYNVDNKNKSLTECLFLYRWFKLFLSLCSSLDKDGAYCLLCPLFAGKKNTAAKSFIFKRFTHWPDGMGPFKRHIDPKHGVHTECILDYDLPFFCLKGKSVFINVYVSLKPWKRIK